MSVFKLNLKVTHKHAGIDDKVGTCVCVNVVVSERRNVKSQYLWCVVARYLSHIHVGYDSSEEEENKSAGWSDPQFEGFFFFFFEFMTCFMWRTVCA